MAERREELMISATEKNPTSISQQVIPLKKKNDFEAKTMGEPSDTTFEEERKELMVSASDKNPTTVSLQVRTLKKNNDFEVETMAELSDTIFEEREELMVSASGENPTLRIAHFLKPSVTNPSNHELLPHRIYENDVFSDHKELPLKVRFRGWRYPLEEWRRWVISLTPRYESTWKKAGIHEAIMGSIYKIQKDNELVLGLAEKWNPDTNTFFFSWGEATVTLDDMKVLGGFSLLGDSVIAKLDDQETLNTQQRLIKACREASTQFAYRVSGRAWLRHFMGSGSELEHEAFLSFWLSQYAFPEEYYCIGHHVFPIAINLARGTEIALAPAILSSIYRDLSRLSLELIIASTELHKQESKVLTLFAPFQLVQLWAWERFPKLSPDPFFITDSKSRQARWHNMKKKPIVSKRLAIDSAGESFQWRPYASSVNLDEEQWILVDKCINKEIESLARCLRPSELVGLNYIEQYLPHRVAKQFGLDQDIPSLVARCNENPTIAWSNYSRPIRDAKLYIPSKHYTSGVTFRYSKWWKQSKLDQSYDAIKSHTTRPRNTVRFPRLIVSPVDSSLEDGFLTIHTTGVEGSDNGAQQEIQLASTAVEPHSGSKSQNIPTSAADSIFKDCFLSVHTMEIEDSSIRDQQQGLDNHQAPATVKPVSKSESQNIPTSAADGRVVKNMEPEIPVIDQTTMDTKTEFGTKESKAGQHSNSFIGTDIPELEARIRRLEEVMGELKKTRFPHLFQENPTKESFSDD